MFFNPHPWFADRLAEIAKDRLVIEVGCGEGHLLKALRDRNIDAYGVDIFNQVSFPSIMAHVLEANALTCPMVTQAKDALIIVARPCHSEWVQILLDVVDPSCDFMYIGLRKNVRNDLGRHLPMCQIHVHPVNESDAIEEIRPRDMPSIEKDPNHVVYFRPGCNSLLRKRDGYPHLYLYLYSLVRNEHTNQCWWAEPQLREYGGETESVLVNDMGGFCRVTADDKTIRTEIHGPNELLDMRETSEYQDVLAEQEDLRLDSGWIDREGHYWRCSSMGHIRLLRMLFSMTEGEAGSRGWIRVHGASWQKRFWYFDGRDRGLSLTPEQVRCLRGNGFPNIDDEGYEIVEELWDKDVLDAEDP